MSKLDINNMVNDLFKIYMTEQLEEQRKMMVDWVCITTYKIKEMFDGEVFNQQMYDTFDKEARIRYSKLRQDLNYMNGELNMIRRLKGEEVYYK